MSLPSGLSSKVRIGCADYTIVPWTSHQAGDYSRHGEHSSTLRELRICFEGRGDSAHATTLLHEIIHAVWYQYGLEDEDKEERVVTVLSNGLSAALRDSPDVFAWIAKSVRA